MNILFQIHSINIYFLNCISYKMANTLVNDPRFNTHNKTAYHMFLQLHDQKIHQSHLNRINSGKEKARSILNEQIAVNRLEYQQRLLVQTNKRINRSQGRGPATNLSLKSNLSCSVNRKDVNDFKQNIANQKLK